MRGRAEISRSANSYMRRRAGSLCSRSACPRELEAAIALRALRMVGLLAGDRGQVSPRLSTRPLFSTALPTPMLTTIFWSPARPSGCRSRGCLLLKVFHVGATLGRIAADGPLGRRVVLPAALAAYFAFSFLVVTPCPRRAARACRSWDRSAARCWRGSASPPGRARPWASAGSGACVLPARFTPSTITLPCAAMHALDLAAGRPLSLPAITRTVSPLRTSSHHLLGERDDLHEVALAQLARDGAEDARARGLPSSSMITRALRSKRT